MPSEACPPTDHGTSVAPHVGAWIETNIGMNNPNHDKLNDVLEVRKAFNRWQNAHPERVKVPD